MSIYVGIPNLNDETVWVNAAHIVSIAEDEQEDWLSGRKTIKWRTTITTTSGNGLGGGCIRTLCETEDVLNAVLSPGATRKVEVKK